MEKPSIKDIVEFAKAGWKPSDVKEILEAASRVEEKPVEEPAEITPKEDVQPEQEKTEEPKPEEASKDNNELERLKNELAKAQSELKTVQEQNTKKDLQGTVQTTEDRLNDIARSFM